MAANTTPVFIDTPLGDVAQVSAANTNRDGTGTIVDVVTGATDGTRIDAVQMWATVTTTAGMVRLYYYNGSVTRLIGEAIVEAITVGASTKAWNFFYRFDEPLLLPSGHKLQASTHNAEAINLLPFGGDF